MQDPGNLETLLRSVAVFSPGIARIPHLSALLGGARIVSRERAEARPGAVDSVVGWGHKDTARAARSFAARHERPYLALEDGFLRSAGPVAPKPPPISIVLDDLGIYYEASAPSRLERLIPAITDPGLLAAGREVWTRVAAHRIGKYNTIGRTDLDAVVSRRLRALLVDQTFGDQSVAGAGADAATFVAMLDEALTSFGAAEIAVKVHPDVIAGRAKGYLALEARRRGLTVIADHVDPYALVERFDEIWTVSSGLGFEALLAGRKVRVFAAPFYAGWGLTHDTPRRAEVRTWLARRGRCDLDRLVAAALVSYPRYADPMTGEPIHVFSAIDRLVDWRERFAARDRARVCVGFKRDRRAVARSLFGAGPGGLFFAEPSQVPAVVRRTGGIVTVWGYGRARDVEQRIGSDAVALERVGPGLLRTQGISTPQVPSPGYTVDDLGFAFDPHRVSRFERIAREADYNAMLIARGRALKERIAALPTSRPARGPSIEDIEEKALGRRVVLVAGDVAEGAPVKLAADRVRTNAELLKAIRSEDPDAYLVFHEPRELAYRRRAGWLADAMVYPDADLVLRYAPVTDYLAGADEFHSIASSAGIEAIARGLDVVCWGASWYSGWGLTRDRVVVPRRDRFLEKDEFFAAALILYTRWVDPVSMMPCEAEDILRRLEERARAVPEAYRRVSWVVNAERRLKRLESHVRHGIMGLFDRS